MTELQSCSATSTRPHIRPPRSFEVTRGQNKSNWDSTNSEDKNWSKNIEAIEAVEATEVRIL